MKVSEFLAETGMRTNHFCEKIGIAPSTLHSIVTGRTMPSLPTAIAIHHFTEKKVKYEDMLIESNDTAAVKHRNRDNKKKD